jgi:hypothetical protein
MIQGVRMNIPASQNGKEIIFRQHKKEHVRQFRPILQVRQVRKVSHVRQVIYLFHPCTKVIQGIWMNIPASQNGEKIVFRQRHLFSFDEINSFVLQRRRPVGVADQVAGEVLADDQFLNERKKNWQNLHLLLKIINLENGII